MSDLSATHAFAAMTAIRYDDAHSLLYVANNGYISEWNPFSGWTTSFWIPNGYLGDVDITADGRYALFNDWNGAAAAGLVRLDLASNSVSSFTGPSTPFFNVERLVTLQSGQALIVTNDSPTLQIEAVDPSGSAWVPLARVFAAGPADQTQHYPVPIDLGMTASENHRFVLIQAEQNLTPTTDGSNTYYPIANQPTALYLYDSATRQITASNTSAFADGYNRARYSQASGNDVSESAQMAVAAHAGMIDVFDLSLRPLTTLSVNGGNLSSAHFSSSGRQLFAFNAQTNDVLVFDTLYWTQEGVIHVGTAADAQEGVANFSNFGQLTTSTDGRMLFLQDYVQGVGAVVDAIDLASRLSLTVTGDASHHILFGSVGADTLTGGAENDTIEGGGGDDRLDGGPGLDLASYESAPAGVTVSLLLQGAAQDTRSAGSDTLYNFEGLIGSKFSDHLTGDANDNVIDGGGGDDFLDGGAGRNTVSFASAQAGVTVSLALQGSVQDTGTGSDTLLHFRNLTGSAFSDRLAGDANDNVLTGGGGADTFVFSSGSGHDSVSDFSHAQGDQLDLSSFHLTSLADVLRQAVQSGSDTVFTFGADSLTLQNFAKTALTAHDLGLAAPSHDLTGTGYSAIVFREPGGQWGYAAFNASGSYNWQPMGGSTPSYGMVGTGDFNGDGASDLLFRESSTGNWGFAQMNRSGGYVWNFMGGSTASYGEVAVGDVSGDGTADIVFREQTTGAWGIAEMHGASYVWRPMGGSTQSYSLAGTGDFNGDGVADILFRDNHTGDWGFAEMHGTTYLWHPMGASTASYSVAGIGDFNGDGVSDILFRNNATGDWGYAQMHGASYAWLPMGGSTASYSVVGTGDYNGDGTADVAFREASTGNWGYAAMRGTSWDWHFMGGSTASYGAF